MSVIHLFKKAKELEPKSEYYNTLAPVTAEGFYSIVNEYIVKIQDDAPRYFRLDRQKLYYSAIAKIFNHFESCFEIWNDTEYLKEYVLHLSGYRRYAWFNMDRNNKIEDLGIGIFRGGASIKLRDLITKIKEKEPNYLPPKIKYGYYFELVSPISNSSKISNKRLYWSWIFAIIILCCLIFPIFIGSFKEALIFYSVYAIAGFLFSPLWKHNLNILQQAAIWILKKIDD